MFSLSMTMLGRYRESVSIVRRKPNIVAVEVARLAGANHIEEMRVTMLL